MRSFGKLFAHIQKLVAFNTRTLLIILFIAEMITSVEKRYKLALLAEKKILHLHHEAICIHGLTVIKLRL